MSLANTNSTLAHWLITQLYIKVSFETRLLLDPGIYFNHTDKLLTIGTFQKRIRAANYAIVALVLALGVCIYFGASDSYIIIDFIGDYGDLFLLILFTAAWGWTLSKL